MTITQTITIALSSSVLASILTVFFQWRFKFLDYRLDYKRKIIDKRIIAYENIDIITWQLGFVTQDKEKIWSGVFSSEKDFDNFIVHLAIARKSQIWLSEELTDKLTKLNVFLTNLENDNNPKSKEEYKNIGKENFEKIRKFRIEIETIYKKDFYELDKVDKFLKYKADKINTYKLRKKRKQ